MLRRCHRCIRVHAAGQTGESTTDDSQIHGIFDYFIYSIIRRRPPHGSPPHLQIRVPGRNSQIFKCSTHWHRCTKYVRVHVSKDEFATFASDTLESSIDVFCIFVDFTRRPCGGRSGKCLFFIRSNRTPPMSKSENKKIIRTSPQSLGLCIVYTLPECLSSLIRYFVIFVTALSPLFASVDNVADAVRVSGCCHLGEFKCCLLQRIWIKEYTIS